MSAPSSGPAHVVSRLPEPERAQCDSAVEFIRKLLQSLPHQNGVVATRANSLIAKTVEAGHSRNVAEWGLVRMQEYGWVELSTPKWGGVISSSHPVKIAKGKVTSSKDTAGSKQPFFGKQDYDVAVMSKLWGPKYCADCKKLLVGKDADRDTCHDCRKITGKLLEVYCLIHTKDDSPKEEDPLDQIQAWSQRIRPWLSDEFGAEFTDKQLWLAMSNRIKRNLMWDDNKIKGTKCDDIVGLIESGQLDKRERNTTIGAKGPGRNPDDLTEEDMKILHGISEGKKPKFIAIELSLNSDGFSERCKKLKNKVEGKRYLATLDGECKNGRKSIPPIPPKRKKGK